MTDKSKFKQNRAMIDHILEYIAADSNLEREIANAMEGCTCYKDRYTTEEFRNWLSDFNIKENVKE